jgi:sugar lactone lactonase YvrE
VPGEGAEDVLVDAAGDVWTGTADGSIFRVAPDGTRFEKVADTGGRPLGLELLPDGRILVCDARAGLLAVDESGAVEVLLREVHGVPMKFCNNAAVTADGDIWFSDSSTVYGIEDWKADFVENPRAGRLLCRRKDGTVEVHLDGLAFANGVALAPDESFVCVAESAGRTVVRLWLSGDLAGTTDVLTEGLPGYPDNISTGGDGLIWVTVASPVDPLVEQLRAHAPLFVRKLITRLPEAVQPAPKRTVRAQAFDSDGRLVHDVVADPSEYHMATGVREHDGDLWLGSLHEPAIAVVSL